MFSGPNKFNASHLRQQSNENYSRVRTFDVRRVFVLPVISAADSQDTVHQIPTLRLHRSQVKLSQCPVKSRGEHPRSTGQSLIPIPLARLTKVFKDFDRLMLFHMDPIEE